MTAPSDRPASWADHLRRDLGRSVVQLAAGILAATLAYIALVVATLSWCIPDSCEQNTIGILVGTVVFGAAAAGALRWLSLGRLRRSRAGLVGAVVAVVLAAYEAFEHFVF